MSAHVRTILALAVIAASYLAITVPHLDDPPFRPRDEVRVSQQARSIASSGRDLDGRLLPLFFHGADAEWLQPVPVYATAALLKIADDSGEATRWPTAIVGLVDVLMMFFVARLVFRSEVAAIVASLLLVLTPAHFVHSRMAVDALYPVPFVLLWLIAVSMFLERRRPWLLALGAAALGSGFYSSPPSVIMMPVYALLTWLVLWREDRANGARNAGVCAAGFALPLLMLVPWFLSHPETYMDTIGAWGVHQAHIRNPLEGVRAALNWGHLALRVWLYWDFFNPAYLFFTGASNLGGAARHIGVFPLVFAILLPAGLYRMTRSGAIPTTNDQRPKTNDQGPTTATTQLILMGFILAPLAAATFDQRAAVGRELHVLPFAVLIATFGVMHLLAGKWSRLVGVALLVLAPIQFGYVYADTLMQITPGTIARSILNQTLEARGFSRATERIWD